MGEDHHKREENMQMKRHQKAQGLVEYSLALVLVAIVVIAIIQLLGPTIGGLLCEITYQLSDIGVNDNIWPTYNGTIALGAVSVTLDVTTDLEKTCVKYMIFGDVDSSPSFGTSTSNKDGTFSYAPEDVGAGIDDNFTYDWHYFDQDSHIGLVTITYSDPNTLVSQAVFQSSSENPSHEQLKKSKYDDGQEEIFALLEAAEKQEEYYHEGVEHSVEATVEGLEVLIEFSDDQGNLLLANSLSELSQSIENGNLEAVPEVISQFGNDLAEIPFEVWLESSLRMAPHLIDSCVAVSEGFVPPNIIDEAFQALEALDEDHPGKVKAMQLLQDAVTAIEDRNSAADEFIAIQSEILDTFVAGFELAGEVDIASQLAADSQACSP